MSRDKLTAELARWADSLSYSNLEVLCMLASTLFKHEDQQAEEHQWRQTNQQSRKS